MSSCSLPYLPLRAARVHEVCGPSALVFAAITCAQSRQGHCLWIAEAWRPEVLNPVALASFMEPARMLSAHTGDQTESLAVAEEALRDGIIPVVIIETTRPLNLREGRRLQLAAKAGDTTGLCIIPERMGSNAAETRWRTTPVLDPAQADSTLMCWEIIKNKSGTLGAWHVRWDAAARRLHMVSPAGFGPGSEGAPG